MLGCAFYVGFNGLDCLLGCCEGYNARGVVEPLYSEVGIASEVVSYGLVGHVIDAVQVPGIFPDLNIILSEVHIIFLVKVAYHITTRIPVWLTLI